MPLIFVSMIAPANAGDYRHHDTVNNYYETTEVTQDSIDESSGIALALATYHPFDYATKKWQASANSAIYDGQSALSMGLAKRFDGMDALLHTSYGQNNGKDALTFGLLWRF